MSSYVLLLLAFVGDVNPISSDQHAEKEPAISQGPSAPSSIAATWSSERVAQWLDDNDLSDLKQKFRRLKGKHLKQMFTRYQRNPEVFDSTLKAELEMDFISILILTTALEELFT